MGQVQIPAPVKFFCGLLMGPTISQDEVEHTLEPVFGPVVSRSALMPFTQTSYYEREMGGLLVRCYVAFKPLRSVSELAEAKHLTNELENLWSVAGKHRQVNLDPGYLDLAKVVLATTKDYTHRLYIGAGMYAEVTLRYHHNSYQPWEWTYPDYRDATALTFFNQLREVYKAQLRGGKEAS
jgi:hypothetical protein